MLQQPTPGSCCHYYALLWGLGSNLPRTFLPKQTFFTSCSRCKTVTSSLSHHPPPLPLHVFPVFQRRLLSPASLSHLSALPPLDPVSSSLQDDEGYSQVLRREEYTFSYIKNLAGRVRLRKEEARSQVCRTLRDITNVKMFVYFGGMVVLLDPIRGEECGWWVLG